MKRRGFQHLLYIFIFLTPLIFFFSRFLPSAYSWSSAHFPDKQLSDLVLSVEQECHQPFIKACAVGKTLHLQTGFKPGSTAPKAPYNFLQLPQEVTEQRFKWFFATGVSNSNQVGDGRRRGYSEELHWSSNTSHSVLSQQRVKGV